MPASPVLTVKPLSFPWATEDPFLFCVYHRDDFPRGNGALGPAASLAGRQIGHDMSGQDGWSMYHGQTVPGFPAHPHRGFETVTIVRHGFVDHSDSLGATARFGEGDVQWVTAGRGLVHAEMFPLLQRDAPNPMELFQIWLNLPRRAKLAPPHFTMLWNEQVPRRRLLDAHGREAEVTVVAGRFADSRAPAPPPDSWAAQEDADVAIWTLRLAPQATLTLPAAGAGTRRTLYFFCGDTATVADHPLDGPAAITLQADAAVTLQGGEETTEYLLLQGRPIGEPVAHYGPFVMNTQQELVQAVQDYRDTAFGGWPFDADDPVHGPAPRRFARYPDGREETPGA